MATIEVTADNFEEIIEGNEIVILDCYANWCGPCRTFEPVFEQASEAHPDIVFGKIDTEEEGDLREAFGIRSIPTLMVFRDQIVVFDQAGMLSAPVLEELISRVKGLDMDEVRRQIAEHEADEEHECVSCGCHGRKEN